MIDLDYPDDEASVDGLANLKADGEIRVYKDKARHRIASRNGIRIGSAVVGKPARDAAEAQDELRQNRFAHRTRSCWCCDSGDVGYDHQRARWSCVTHWRD